MSFIFWLPDAHIDRVLDSNQLCVEPEVDQNNACGPQQVKDELADDAIIIIPNPSQRIYKWHFLKQKLLHNYTLKHFPPLLLLHRQMITPELWLARVHWTGQARERGSPKKETLQMFVLWPRVYTTTYYVWSRECSYKGEAIHMPCLCKVFCTDDHSEISLEDSQWRGPFFANTVGKWLLVMLIWIIMQKCVPNPLKGQETWTNIEGQ